MRKLPSHRRACAIAVPAAGLTRTTVERLEVILHHHHAIALVIGDRGPIAAMNAQLDATIGNLKLHEF